MFDITQRIFIPLAAIPAVFVWWVVYWYAPKDNLHIPPSPYERMQWAFALASGMMIGQLFGHALPNAVLYSSSAVPFLAAIVGMVLVLAFFKMARVTGRATNQVLFSTQYEPVELYTAAGEEANYTELERAAFIADETATDSSFAGFDSAHEDDPVQEEAYVMPAHQTMLSGNDAHDVRWIRRGSFYIMFVTICFMVIFEGPFLIYHSNAVSPVLSIPAFYAMKMMQAFILSCYAVHAYDHMRKRKFLFLTFYAWMAVAFGVCCVLSTIPVLVEVDRLGMSLFIQSQYFGGFYELFAGALATMSLYFITREDFQPTLKKEIIWLALFTVGAVAMWGLGLII